MKTEADRQLILGEEGCIGRGCPYTGHIDFGGNGPPVETQLFWIFPEAWTSVSQLQRQHLGNRVSFINPAPNVITWYKTVSCTLACFTCSSMGHLPSTASALCLPDSPELHFGPWAGWHSDGWLQAVTPNGATCLLSVERIFSCLDSSLYHLSWTTKSKEKSDLKKTVVFLTKRST